MAIQNNKYGCVIPVAGLSSRMGEFKPLLMLENDMTMIEHTVSSVLNSNVENCVLVLGYQGKKIEAVFHEKRYNKNKIHFIYNHEFQTSDMMRSIQLGIRKLMAVSASDAMFILPGDMPRVSKETFMRLQNSFEQEHSLIIFPTYEKKTKHPPLIAQNCFLDILHFNQGGGLRKALDKFKNQTNYVEINDYGCCLDADTKSEFYNVQNFSV